MKTLNIRLALLVLSVLFSPTLFAQDYSFMVLGAKGDSKADGSTLKVGARLTKSQKIEVGKGAYLGLAHSSGKTLEIKKKGAYPIKDLEAKIAKLNDNTTGQIAMFILDELTSDDNKSNRFSHSAVKTGSVMRATPNASNLKVMLPEQTEFLPGKVTIKWYTEDGKAAEKYTFIAKNLRNEEVIRKEVSTPYVSLDLSTLNEFDAKLLKYQVVANDVKSEEQGLKLPKTSEALTKLNEEAAKLPKGNTPMESFLRAEFYAQKGMLANAVNAYEEAGEAFEDSYKAFLKAFKLTQEARKKESEKK